MRRPALNALAALAWVALNGCDKPASADAEPSAPLASVNGVDIRMLAPASARVDNARVDALIDSQLLQEEAIRNKLDRDPLVQQAIAQAHTEILAKAQLQRQGAALPAPTRADIDAYIAAHPELFSERKSFQIEQLVLDSKDFTPALKLRLDGASSIGQLARWLDTRGVHYTRARLARNSAELDPALLERLQTMRKHQLFVVVAGPETTLDALLDVVPDPVPHAAAMLEADAILRREARALADKAEIKRLRALAKIAYFNKQQGSAANTLGALPPKQMETQ